MSTVRRALKNLVSLTAGSIVMRLLGFIVTAYLARILGVYGFGELGFASTIVLYFSVIIDQGFGTFGTREIARDREHIQRYVNSLFTMQFLLSLIAYGGMFLFVLWMNKPAEIKTLILLYGLQMFSGALGLNYVFRGIERMGFITVNIVLGQILYVIGIFLIVSNASQLVYVPLIYVISGFIGIMFMVVVYVRRFGMLRFDFNFPFWKEILRQSLPMGITMILGELYLEFGIVWLGFAKGEHMVGLYIAAYKIVLIVSGLRKLYYDTTFPIASRFFKDSLKNLRALTLYSVLLSLMLTVPIAIIGTLFAGEITTFIYGGGFKGSIVVLQILLWSLIFDFVGQALINVLVSANRQKFLMMYVLVAATVNVAFNVLLIPAYDVVGAGVAKLVSTFAMLVMAYVGCRSIVRLSPKDLFSKKIVTGFVSSIKESIGR
jgi:O-antigen/teichoic acid export membrane protein